MKLPPPLNWLYKGWMAFSHALGMVMSRIILTILWVVGFGLYGIILKIIRLFKPESKEAASYWTTIPPRETNSFRQQF